MDFRKISIGGHIIENIFMLDSETCNMCFVAENNEEGYSQIEVEYWLDEKTWHFIVKYYDFDGDYVDWTECDSFTDEERMKCMDIIKEYIKNYGKY